MKIVNVNSKMSREELLEIIEEIYLTIDRNKGKYIYPDDVFNYIRKIDLLCQKALGFGQLEVNEK